MILFIDSSDFNKVSFAVIGKTTRKKTFPQKYFQSEKTLEHLQKFLGKRFFEQAEKDLKKIYVVSGPGSFTGIRVGIAIGLGFSLAWQIPLLAITKGQIPKELADLPKVEGRKVDSGFEPDYGAEPNITPQKKR